MSARVDELALAWSAWAGPRALQFTLLAAALLVVDRFFLRRAWPRLRLALHGVALLGLVLPPLPSILPAPSILPSMVPQFLRLPALDSTGVAAGRSPLTFAFLVWLAIAALLAFGAMVRHARVRRRLRALDLGVPVGVRSRVASLARQLRLRRVPEVVVLPGAASPAVLGCWRPLVLLPSALVLRHDEKGENGENEEHGELGHSLLHELLHVKRGDLVAALFGRLVAIVWWFHPLAWIVARRATALRELACDDDVALLLHERAPAYRATLLERARALVAEPEHPDTIVALGFFGMPSTLLARLEWLARPRHVRPRLERGVTWLAAGALAFGALPPPWVDRGVDRGAERGVGASLSATTSSAALRAGALDIVNAALRGERPPGCVRLHNAVSLLAASGSREPAGR